MRCRGEGGKRFLGRVGKIEEAPRGKGPQEKGNEDF